MKDVKSVMVKMFALLFVFTVFCGGVYPAVVTVIAQAAFPDKANGSVIEVDGKKYGSVLLGQQFTGEEYMWGRIMNVDTATYTDKEGNALMYAVPSNKSPASTEYEEMVAKRVENIKIAHPEKGDTPIPVDLVTCSGSGLDPHISLAAAEYQAERIAENRGISVEKVQEIIDTYTTGKTFGIMGEEVVNVLEVNLALDGILN